MRCLRFLFLSLGAIFVVAWPPLRADLLVKPNDVVMVAMETPMMQGWASVDIAQYLLVCQPVEGLKVIQSNDGQEEIEPFLNRIPTDIAFWHPTVAMISHGVNSGRDDAQSKDYTFYHPLDVGKTIDALKAIGVRTIMLGSINCVDSTNFGSDPAQAKTYNDNLAAFRDLDRQLADKAGIPFVDVFTPMMDAMSKAKAAYGEKYVFGGNDGRYPNRNAQLVMAYAFLKAIGCDGAIGTITVDLGTNTAMGTPGQKILSVKDGAVEVESTRYPYCFQGDPKEPDATSGIISCFPFNEDLNRYLLVVHGLKGASAKVTWGNESREFPVADLEKGVNLAAAFAAHTPFDLPFLHIQDAIWQQQLKQYYFTGIIAHNMDDLKQMAPGGPFDQLITGVYAQNDKNSAAVAAMAVPIQHTLKIEALP
jgi:hypothetical protein